MLLNDPFQNFGGAMVIPDSLGINDRDGTLHTDPQTVGLGPINQGLRPGELQFFEASFEKFPGGQPRFPRAAFGFGGISA
jgi:hypothetical protein